LNDYDDTEAITVSVNGRVSRKSVQTKLRPLHMKHGIISPK